MIRDVLRMGDPRLLRRARPVEAFGTPELAGLLADMRDGETGVIARISDTDPAMLRYFDEVGITLDRLVRIADKRPFAGTTTITVDDVEPAITLGDVATRAIYVATSG